MSKLALSVLGDLVDPVETWSPERDARDDSFVYIDLSAVDQDAKAITGAREMPCGEAPSRARQLIAAGDVLVSTVRPNLNAVAQVPSEFNGATASTGFCVLRPRPDTLVAAYLLHWVRSPRFVSEMVRRATGASYPAVSDRIILESSLPLPPLPEQRRIAEVLDRAEALRAKRRHALAQLDTLTQSIFLNMFGDPATNPKGWPKEPLSEHASKIGSGATPLGGEEAYKAAGITLIRSMNVRDGVFLRDGLAFIDDEQASRLDGVIVEADDVLLNITGASVARVCRAPADLLPARVNQHVAIIRPTKSLNSVFLEKCLLSPSVKKGLLRIAGAGATREAITKAEIEQFRVIRPPRELQDSFAAVLMLGEQTQGKQNESLAELGALFASIQHRAFRGEL